jgi:cell division protein FtsI (penicillin-binding protein 3)
MSSGLNKWVRLRIIVVAAFLTLSGVWLCGRFFLLQVIRGADLREEAAGEYQKYSPALPVRGMILDRRGTELALSTQVSSLVAHPSQIKDASRLSRELAPVLGLKTTEIKEVLTRARPFVWVKRHLTPEREEAFLTWKAAKERKDTGVKGAPCRRDEDAVYLIPEARRYYPHLSLCGSVLGFCNIDGEGMEGAEHQFNEYLYGKPKKCWKMIDARGHIVVTGEKAMDPEVMGNNAVLTIDRTLQYIAEKELAKGVEKYQAAGGLALVVQPQTGEVLAMAQMPAMDPNRYAAFPEAARKNRHLTDALEPGSTYKIFIAASALDAQVVKPTDKFHCENGVYHLGSKDVIHDVHPYGTLCVQQIIQKSSNIGATKIASRLGGARLYNYLRDFGFGRRTGIHFPGESAGLLKDLKAARSAIDRATVAFGQGVSVTPLQMTMALASMGNEGVLMEPMLVKEVLSPLGEKVEEFRPRPVRRVLSQRAAQEMLDIMATVTQPGGTAPGAVPAGFTVAGKTGTAQKLVGRAYSHSKFNALFIGMVPAHKPVLAITVIIDEPKGAIFGGVVAAPVFKEIAGQSLRVLGYYPQQELKDPKKENLPVLAKQEVKKEAKKEAQDQKQASKKEKLQDEEKPAPVVAGMIPTLAAATQSEAPEVTPVLVSAEALQEPLKVMPDLKGRTIRQVLDLLHRAGLHCRFEGSGLAVGQNPSPGAAIAPGDTCSVKFQASS